ncbi:MAG: hypothetical protein GC168_12055 [Candidatus Hydrogenedens sp.]|nr:hypothetical protein [Candidatus Hydrogenedens sp.]
MRYFALILMLGAAVAGAEESGPLVFDNSDFEKGTLENWSQEGSAFVFQPTFKDNTTARRSDRRTLQQGQYWIGTFEKYQGNRGQKPGGAQGNELIGGLMSIPFVIDKPVITFLVGGGADKRATVQLIANGAVVAEATGADHPLLRREYWDVAPYVGKQAMLYIVDRATGFFGFINADDFRYAESIPDRSLFPNSQLAGGTLEGWTAEGGAFEAKADGPATSSAENLGALTSPEFELTGEAIVFQFAGGEGATVKLLVGGQPLYEEKPRSADQPVPHVLDVGVLKGKKAVLQISDASASAGLQVGGFHYGR